MENQNTPLSTPNLGSLPVSIPGTPVSLSIDPVALVNGILNCYKEAVIAKEEQLTLRTQIREQSRVYIAAIEANTKEFEMALEQIKVERMGFVSLLCDIIRQKGVDEYSLRLCEMILQYLTNTNPLNHAGKSLQFASAATGMIGIRE